MISKVLLIRNGPYPVNINMYNDQFVGLARSFAKKGIDSEIIYYSKKNNDFLVNKNPEIKIKNMKGIRVLRTGIYPQVLKKDFLNKYDLIITTEYSQIMTVLLGLISPKPVILYTGPYYNLFKIPCISFIYDFLFTKIINRKMSKILTKSSLATSYLKSKGYTKLTTIGVGQDLERFEESIPIGPKTEKIVTYLKKNKTILIVGSIDDRKNYFYTLSIFKKLLQADSSYQLLIVGEGKKAFIQKGLNSLSDYEKSRIKFAGKINNQQLKYIYPEAHVLLLPSKLEIFGMVLLEAMYFKVPVISSINGGSKTLIDNGINGFMLDIQNSDIDAWVDKILSLEDRKLRDNICREAYGTITNSYTWNDLSEYFLN